MTQPAGWYDDPQDAAQLRYWDGVQWTHHTSPRQRPTPQPQGGDGYGQGAGGQYGGGGGQYNPYGGQYGQSRQPGSYPQQGGMYAPMGDRTRTPDGQELAGWWLRLLARIIDGILVGLVVGGIGFFVIFSDLRERLEAWIDELQVWAEAGGTATVPPIPSDIATDIGLISLMIGVSALVYETVLTSRLGGTLGKLMVGLRVRLREQPGNIGWGPSALRALVWQGPSFIGAIPLIGFFASVFGLLNGLWPLWDDKKQSISDKVAKTNVVKHRR